MPTTSQYQPVVSYDQTATIASSGTTSSVIDLRGCILCGIYFPASLTSTAVGFSTSTTAGGTFVVMVDGAGANYSKTVAASKYLPLNPADFAGVQFIKIVMGSSEGAERILTLALRPV